MERRQTMKKFHRFGKSPNRGERELMKCGNFEQFYVPLIWKLEWEQLLVKEEGGRGGELLRVSVVGSWSKSERWVALTE